MKKAAYVVTALFLLIANVCFAGEYADEDYGYSVAIPDRWETLEGVGERYRCGYVNKDEAKIRFMSIRVMYKIAETVPNLYSVPDYRVYSFLNDYSGIMRRECFDRVKAEHKNVEWLNARIVKLSNNIWVVCTMRDELETPIPLNIVFAGTILDSKLISLDITYMGDEHSAETVFKQILESVKPL